MTYWQPNTDLTLWRIPEAFNIIDFCDLIKKNVFKSVNIELASSTSKNYQDRFKAAFQSLKNVCGTEFYINGTKFNTL